MRTELLGMGAPTLVTLYGDAPNGNPFTRGYRVPPSRRAEVRAIMGEWGYLTPEERKADLRAYPELLGVWPILAKVAAVGAKVGAKIGKRLFKRIRKRIKKRRAKRRKKRPVAPAPPPPVAVSPALAPAPAAPVRRGFALDPKILAAIGIPLAVGAVMLLRR